MLFANVNAKNIHRFTEVNTCTDYLEYTQVRVVKQQTIIEIMYSYAGRTPTSFEECIYKPKYVYTNSGIQLLYEGMQYCQKVGSPFLCYSNTHSLLL